MLLCPTLRITGNCSPLCRNRHFKPKSKAYFSSIVSGIDHGPEVRQSDVQSHYMHTMAQNIGLVSICPCGLRQVKDTIKFVFGVPRHFQRCVTCHGFPTMTNIGNVGSMFLHPVDGRPNPECDAKIKCRTCRPIFLVPSISILCQRALKWRQFCHYKPGFGHDARIWSIGHPSRGQCQVKKIIQFDFSTSGWFKQHATCQ